jgi:dipeptidyl aminopeptidase/acylaminoacyl peptidase
MLVGSPLVNAQSFELHDRTLDGRWVLQRVSDPVHNYRFRLVDTQQETTVELTMGSAGRVDYAATLMQDGSVLLLSDQGDPWTGLYLRRVDGSSIRLDTGRWDVEQFVLSADESTLFFTKNEDGLSKLYRRRSWDKEVTETLELPLPPGWAYGLTATENGGVRGLINTWDNPDSTFKVSSDGQLETDAGSLPGRQVTLVDRQDVSLTGWYFQAQPGRRVGMIVFFHGGPQAQYRPAYDPLFQALLTRGWSVMAPNVQGSRGYGREFMARDDGDRRTAAVSDTLAAARWAREHAPGQPVLLLGSSYGAYLGLLSLLQDGTAWDGAILHAGPYLVSSRSRNERELAEYGPAETQTELSDLIAAAPDSLPPVLLLHGETDRVVPAENSRELAKLLEGRQAWVSSHILAGAGHSVQSLAPLSSELLLFLERFAPSRALQNCSKKSDGAAAMSCTRGDGVGSWWW